MSSGRCLECTPIEPARAYSDRLTQPLTGAPPAIAAVVDVRRTTGEWVTEPDERDPQTRRAHPTLVRTALAEAEERARDRAARSEFVTRVASDTQPHYRPKTGRLRAVTPLPPAPVGKDEPDPSLPPSVQFSSAIAPIAANETPAPNPARELAAVVPATEIPVLFETPSRLASQPVTRESLRPMELPDVEPESRRAHVFWIGLAVAVGLMLVAAVV